jgi:hypothetical protein
MRFGGMLSVFLVFSIALLSQQNQNLNVGHPQEMTVQHHATPEEIRDRASTAQFQKDLKELSELCASVPHDMDGLKQGILSREVIDRLKRMEKLSRHVREQLTRN